MTMEEVSIRLNEDNLYAKVDTKSPPAKAKVVQWWETVDEGEQIDPNRRSSASRESMCQWSVDAQSTSSSIKRRRERASRKERQLREAMEQELRRRQRRERRQQQAKNMGRDRDGLNVQDRSKSKAARIREEAKYGKRLFRDQSQDSSSSVEFVMKESGPKRIIEDKRLDEKRTKRFSAVLEPFHHEARNRPRIVLTQKPRPNQGIFGQGASSGEHRGKEPPIHPKKKMPRPGTNSSHCSIIEYSPQPPLAAAAHKEAKQIDVESQSSKTQNSHAKNSFQALADAEKTLRKVLQVISENNEKKRRIQMQSIPDHNKAVSRHGSEDGHSAYSNAKRRQQIRDVELKATLLQKEIDLLKSNRSEGSDAHQRHITTDADRVANRDAPRPMDPPPLLAFIGDRPHQHVNAWRGQHSRNEPDPIQLRTEMEENGGINMRARESLVTARTRRLPREYFGVGQVPQWEVMPASEHEYYSPHQYQMDLPNNRLYHDDHGTGAPPDAIDSVMLTGANDFTAEYNDAPWFDTAYEEPAYDQQNQEDYYQDPYLDSTFDPYMMHQAHVVGERDVSNLHAFQGERAVAADWFDQDGYQDEGSWCDRLSEVNEVEPVETSLAPYREVRMAVQPTQEDLSGFWKPQL